MPCRYREDADKSIQDDIVLLSCGYILVIFYVSVMLGNFSRMNTKVSVSSSDFCLSFWHTSNMVHIRLDPLDGVPEMTIRILKPLHSNISMHILHTVLYTFPKVLTRRIC